MSFLTGTQAEILSANIADGTALAASVTATNIEPAPSPTLPANFFDPTYGRGKVLRLFARGVISTPAASQGTITLSFAVGSTPVVLVSTPAVTPVISLANGSWEMEAHAVCRAVGTAGTLQTAGALTLANSPTATVAGVTYGIPANTAPASWPVTVDTTVAQALHVRATWSLATAGCSIQCLQFIVGGDN